MLALNRRNPTTLVAVADGEPTMTEVSISDGPFMTTKEAAFFLKLRPNTLEKMRVYGGGPQYRKHGRHVRYHIDDLTAWSDMRKKDSTSDV